MVTYNYNLEWDRAMRSNPKNLEKDIQEIDVDEELIEDDEVRVELHNWLTDSENSDQSDSDGELITTLNSNNKKDSLCSTFYMSSNKCIKIKVQYTVNFDLCSILPNKIWKVIIGQ